MNKNPNSNNRTDRDMPSHSPIGTGSDKQHPFTPPDVKTNQPPKKIDSGKSDSGKK